LQVQSSEELSQLFEYDYDANWKKHSILGHGATSKKLAKSRLCILRKASDINLFKFVTHQNSQVFAECVYLRFTRF